MAENFAQLVARASQSRFSRRKPSTVVPACVAALAKTTYGGKGGVGEDRKENVSFFFFVAEKKKLEKSFRKKEKPSPHRSVADRVPRLHRLPRPQQRRGVRRPGHSGRVHELEGEGGRRGAGEDARQSVERVAVARVLGRERRSGNRRSGSFRFSCGSGSGCGESGSGGVVGGASLSIGGLGGGVHN